MLDPRSRVRGRRRPHDCLVVTPLTVPELVVPVLVVPVLTVPLLPEDPVLAAAGRELEVALEDVAAEEVVCAASAGSCPETSTSAINSQVATNSPSAPEITRRRIVRARSARASRRPLASRATPRLAVSGLMGVMVSLPRVGEGVAARTA